MADWCLEHLVQFAHQQVDNDNFGLICIHQLTVESRIDRANNA